MSRPSPEEQVLRPALEAALDVAERGQEQTPPVVPPRGLRSVLGFRKRPPTALTAVRRVLESDDEFRSLVAAEADLVALGRGAAAFLQRAAGWEQELADAVAAVNAADAEDRAREVERASLARAAELEARLERLEADNDRLHGLADDLEAVRNALNDERSKRELAEQRADSLEAERQRAVRELTRERRLLAGRTAEVRELRERAERHAAIAAPAVAAPAIAEPSEPGQAEAKVTQRSETNPTTSGQPEADRALLTARLGEAAALARELAEFMTDLTGDDGPVSPDETGEPRRGEAGERRPGLSGPAGGPGAAKDVKQPNGTAAGAVRRNPVRIGRGLAEGSPAATRALLDTPGLVLWVDGYNAAMALWGDLSLGEQRDALVGALGRLAALHGTDIRVVFDGADETATVPSVRQPLPVRVRFSAAGVEADDDILDAVATMERSVPVAVLSADRRVRDGARAHGANLLSPDDLRALL